MRAVDARKAIPAESRQIAIRRRFTALRKRRSILPLIMPVMLVDCMGGLIPAISIADAELMLLVPVRVEPVEEIPAAVPHAVSLAPAIVAAIPAAIAAPILRIIVSIRWSVSA